MRPSSAQTKCDAVGRWQRRQRQAADEVGPELGKSCFHKMFPRVCKILLLAREDLPNDGRLHGVVAQLAIATLTADRAAWHLCPSRSRVRLKIR